MTTPATSFYSLKTNLDQDAALETVFIKATKAGNTIVESDLYARDDNGAVIKDFKSQYVEITSNGYSFSNVSTIENGPRSLYTIKIEDGTVTASSQAIIYNKAMRSSAVDKTKTPIDLAKPDPKPAAQTYAINIDSDPEPENVRLSVEGGGAAVLSMAADAPQGMPVGGTYTVKQPIPLTEDLVLKLGAATPEANAPYSARIGRDGTMLVVANTYDASGALLTTIKVEPQK